MDAKTELSSPNQPATGFNDTYRAFTRAFLSNPTQLNLDESQYQNWTSYLYSVEGTRLKRSVRLRVAEALFTHQYQHPYALGVFLACVYPMAQRCVNRLLVVSAFQYTT